MSSSRFGFVGDEVIQVHLERVFALVIALVTLSEAPQYSDEIKSSFRKTAIIHTASIIEALLLLILKSQKTESDCGEFRDVVDKKLYKISDTETISLVKKKFISANFSKLNLDQINKLCKRYCLINKDLSSKVDTVRDLRNRQHLGSLQEVEVEYTKKDLELVFSVAKEVTDLSENTS